VCVACLVLCYHFFFLLFCFAFSALAAVVLCCAVKPPNNLRSGDPLIYKKRVQIQIPEKAPLFGLAAT
jgi:hypothetical protein